jgi:hypothetical protein
MKRCCVASSVSIIASTNILKLEVEMEQKQRRNGQLIERHEKTNQIKRQMLKNIFYHAIGISAFWHFGISAF